MNSGETHRLICSTDAAYLIGVVQAQLKQGDVPWSGIISDLKTPSSCLGSWAYKVNDRLVEVSESLSGWIETSGSAGTECLESLVHPDDREEFHAHFHNVRLLGGALSLGHRMSAHTGIESPVQSYLYAVNEGVESPNIVGAIFAETTDTAPIKRTTGSAIDLLLRVLPEAIIVSDRDTRSVRYRNRDLAEDLGFTGEKTRTLYDLVHVDDYGALEKHDVRVRLMAPGDSIETSIRLRSAIDEWRWYQLCNHNVEENGRVMTVGIIRDVTSQIVHENQLRDTVRQLRSAEARLLERTEQLEELNRKLATLATTDGLTGLFNYRAMHEKLAEEVRRARRYDYPLSLVVTDIDNFKEYNDRFGHPAGDDRLRQFAHMLKQESRESDFVCRSGGEEFAIVLISTGAADAGRFAQRLVNSLNRQTDAAGLTASFGCVQLEPEDRTKDDLLKRADACLYRAKASGKNCVVVGVHDTFRALTL